MSRNDRSKQRFVKTSTKRALVALAAFVVTAVGLATASGTGTLSAMGIGAVSAICPLGALESMLGTLSFIPRAAMLLLGVVILGVVFGKAFCSWVCPVPHFQNFFKGKKQKAKEREERGCAAQTALENYESGIVPKRKAVPLDTRHAVLGGALLSTAVFGFPVFCLVCPIGLTFATFILLWRFVQFNEPTVGLLVFPAILVLEFVVLRKWCHRICPLGALLSLVAGLNKTFRPTVDKSACLRSDDTACEACAAACPEHIDPYANLGERSLVDCTKCKNCANACPANAISFPLFGGPKGEGGVKVGSGKGKRA